MKIDEIKQILKNVSFAPTNLDMGWQWDVSPTKIYDNDIVSEKGYSIRTTFMRPDANTGEIEKGYGRWMYVPENISQDGLVKTAWVCAELIVKHELMEAFLYQNIRIFDPHKSLEDLQYNSRTVENEISNDTEIKIKEEIVTSEKLFHKQNIDNHTQEITTFLDKNLKKDKKSIENIEVYELSTYKVFHYLDKNSVALVVNDQIKDIRSEENYTMSNVKEMLNDLLLRYNTADPAVVFKLIMERGFTEISDLDGNPEIKVYKNPSKPHRYIIHSNTNIEKFIALCNNNSEILKEFEGENYQLNNIKTLFGND